MSAASRQCGRDIGLVKAVFFFKAEGYERLLFDFADIGARHISAAVGGKIQRTAYKSLRNEPVRVAGLYAQNLRIGSAEREYAFADFFAVFLGTITVSF